MADIAQHVGCSRATVYNHFANRDELLEALCTEYLQGFPVLLVQVRAWAARPEVTVFEVIRETVAAELRWRAAHAQLRGALDSARRLNKDFYARENARIDEAFLAWFRSIYDASDELDLLHDGVELDFAAAAVYIMVDHLVASFPPRTPPDQIAHLADQVARLQWNALYRSGPDESPAFGALRLHSSSARDGSLVSY